MIIPGAICGDGVRAEGEECDDGDIFGGDGCDADCGLEVPDARHQEPDSEVAPFDLIWLEGEASAVLELSEAGDEDWLRLTLEASAEIYIELQDLEGGCGGDLYLEIYEEGAIQPLAADDDDGVGLCPLVSPSRDEGLRALAAGSYILHVRHGGEGGALPWHRLVVRAVELRFPDDPCDEAGRLGRCLEGSFCDLTLPAPVCVADGCGDGRRGASEECDDHNLEDGDGCSAQCFVEAAGPREVEPDSAQSPNALAFGLGGVARTLFSLNPAGDEDWFFINVEPGVDDLVIATYGWRENGQCEGDTTLELFAADDLITPIAADDDDGAGGLCARVSPDRDLGVSDVPPGGYLVKVSGYEGERTGVNWLEVRKIGRVDVGLPCDPDDADRPCVASAYCDGEADQPLCVAHLCGDGRLGPAEECDGGEGCDVACAFTLPYSERGEPDSAEAPTALSFDGEIASGLLRLAQDGDADWFSFTLDATADVRLEARAYEGGGCDGDLVMALYAADDLAAPLATDDNDGEDGCPLVSFAQDAGARDLPPGQYVVRIGGFLDLSAGLNLLEITALPRLDEGAACDADAGTGRCVEGTLCGRVSEGVGTCLPPGCGNGVADPGEACDDGNEDDADGCTVLCALSGPREQEPNDAVAEDLSAPPRGDDPGALYVEHVLSEGDVDRFAFEVEAGPQDAVIWTVDGFGRCPGPIQAQLVEAGGAEILAQTAAGCTPWTARDLEAGRYEVIVEGAGEVITRARFVSVSAAGGDCGAPTDRCADTAWCDVDTCVAHRCGDGRLAPAEECDDGNEEAEDGCSAICTREDITDISGGGLFGGGFEESGSDLYPFTLAGRAEITAEVTEGPEGCPDLVELSLERFEGAWVEIPWTLPAPACAAQIADLPAGDYRLVARGFLNAGVAAYGLSVEIVPLLGPDDLCDGEGRCVDDLICVEATARCGFPEVRADLEAGAVAAGGFDEVGGFEDFTFSLAQRSQASFEVSDDSGRCAQSTLTVYAVGATTLTPVVEAVGGAGRCPVLTTSLAPGDYRARIQGDGVSLPAYALSAYFLEERAEGEACDRAGLLDVCPEGTICLMSETEGEGICGAFTGGVVAPEVEPNGTAAEAEAAPWSPNVRVEARLEAGVDDWDVFAVSLDGPMLLSVQANSRAGGCAQGMDTQLYHVVGATLADAGVDAAIAGALAVSDDEDGTTCSRLELSLDAGLHYFVVQSFARALTFDYALRIRAATPEGDRCDAEGVQTFCATGLSCVDAEGDGDGVCD